MQRHFDRLSRVLAGCGLTIFCLLYGLVACKKTGAPSPAPLTPLQKLINSDTTFSLFHRLLLQGNEAGLLADRPVTLLIPTNAAFRAAGFTPAYIDSIPASQAAGLVLYGYIPSRLSLRVSDSTGYSPYATQLGYPIYAMSDGRQIWFNGSPALADTTSAGQALVYRLGARLSAGYDSLFRFIGGDSTLSFFTEAVRRTRIDTLIRTGPYTVLAPVNSAFIAAGYDSLQAIDSADPGTLSTLLKEHVVPGLLFTNTIAGQASLSTLGGGLLTIQVINGSIGISGSGNASPAALINGNQTIGSALVVHRIGGLLLP